MLRWLVLDVVDPIQLDRLDDNPLPDEPFLWEGIPDDVTARVGELLALTDRCCEEMLDVEYRTANGESLTLDLYYPPHQESHAGLPALMFVIGYPDPGMKMMMGGTR